MNTLPFPPVVLTHITIDNALFHGACIQDINPIINTHQLSHLTAVPVYNLLQDKKLTSKIMDWIKSIAGISINGDGYGNGYRNGEGYGYGNGYGRGYTDGYGNGYGYGGGAGYGYGYGYGESYEEGIKNVDEYEYSYGYGTHTGDGCGYGYGYGNQPPELNSLESKP